MVSCVVLLTQVLWSSMPNLVCTGGIKSVGRVMAITSWKELSVSVINLDISFSLSLHLLFSEVCGRS